MGNEPITVKGFVILSTIKTMETFGDIGRQVLAEHGVTEIDEDKLYSFELRNELHKALLDRFGEDSLIAFGFKNGESFQESVVEKTQEEYESNLNRLLSSKYSDNITALNNIMNCLVSGVNESILKSTHRGSINYGAHLEKLEETKFKYVCITASVPYQLPFMLGTMEYHFARLFAKFWKYNLQATNDLNQSGYGYTFSEYTVKFEKNVSPLTQSEIVTNRKMEIRDKLISSVLIDSNKQMIKIANLVRNLGKYTPPQIHEALVKGEHDTEIKTRRKKLTIFFSDIANFTSTSEGLQPEDLTKYLNEYFSEMTLIALEWGATIDKYIGDAMMVFFGDPTTHGEREDARACVQMALSMQERMRQLQVKWAGEGFADPFKVRMGINTGYCNVGNFGSDQRLTYTIIGAEVNIAQRLESNAKPNTILMSYETYAHAQELIDVEEKPPIEMKGVNRKIKTFSVLGRRGKIEKILTLGSGSDKSNANGQNIKMPVMIEKRFLVLEENINEIRSLIKKINDRQS